jgi:hypothetical protein
MFLICVGRTCRTRGSEQASRRTVDRSQAGEALGIDVLAWLSCSTALLLKTPRPEAEAFLKERS